MLVDVLPDPPVTFGWWWVALTLVAVAGAGWWLWSRRRNPGA